MLHHEFQAARRTDLLIRAARRRRAREARQTAKADGTAVAATPRRHRRALRAA
ncbi:hypothetical protein GCM10009801_19830 [Streptomyces albiaxialis]|uniref:Uncharacterized protein n=1 Tax=Streptomyces albiaxialis TaxID=329523 RepID=A0ABN2VRN8_9ACTN